MTFHPSLAHTRALAMAINELFLFILTVSLCRSATISKAMSFLIRCTPHTVVRAFDHSWPTRCPYEETIRPKSGRLRLIRHCRPRLAGDWILDSISRCLPHRAGPRTSGAAPVYRMRAEQRPDRRSRPHRLPCNHPFIPLATIMCRPRHGGSFCRS